MISTQSIIFTSTQSFDKLWQLVNGLVSIVFHVTEDSFCDGHIIRSANAALVSVTVEYFCITSVIQFFLILRQFLLPFSPSNSWVIIPRKAGYCNHLRVSVCLFVCLFVSRHSHKLLVGFWWILVSREVMIIGRRSSKLGVIRIEIRIWDPDNCFSWTTGRIFGSRFQSDPG